MDIMAKTFTQQNQRCDIPFKKYTHDQQQKNKHGFYKFI